MKTHVIGLGRALAYSPGRHALNDRLILEATAAALTRRGYRVDLLDEEDVLFGLPATPFVFSMCQGPRAVTALATLERAEPDRLVINSASAVLACYRDRLFSRRSELLSLFPPTVRLTPGSASSEVLPGWLLARGGWLKRGDVPSTAPEDVVRVRSLEETRVALAAFHARGIPSAILQEHIDGQVVKFYGVLGTPFFACYAEGDPSSSPASVRRARPLIERHIAKLGLEVYGGDCVLAADGRLLLIDVNDWPSFASFRREASEAIAMRLQARFESAAANETVGARATALLTRA